MENYNSVYSHDIVEFANKVQTYTMESFNEKLKICL